MITKKKSYNDIVENLKNLNEYLPKGYVNEIRQRLEKKGYLYSGSLILSVRSGDRKNIIILEELASYAEENKTRLGKLETDLKKL